MKKEGEKDWKARRVEMGLRKPLTSAFGSPVLLTVRSLALSRLHIGGGKAASLEAMRRRVELPSQNLKRHCGTQGGGGRGVARKVE